MDRDELAPERNRRLVTRLSEVGRELGLDVELEFPTAGGRIDVVWMWSGPAAFPVRLPLVGFEIESSWRTRKHIKGDLLNLMELQPALGVIVLAGAGPRVAATLAFARSLVARHAPRIEVWDEAQAELLQSSVLAVVAARVAAPVRDHDFKRGVGGRRKYATVTNWLRSETADSLDVSFKEIEQRLGYALPPSSRQYAAHWSGYAGSAVARAIKDAGWRAHQLDMAGEHVRLERIGRVGGTEPPPGTGRSIPTPAPPRRPTG